MTMVRNEDYWANKLPEGAIPFWKVDQPYLDEITMVVINDKQAAVKELEKGSLDCDVDVEPDTWLQPDTQADAFTKIMTRAERSSFGYVYIGWNLKNPIFREKETRKALAMLIPRDEIARDLHDDLAERVNGPMYFKSPAYDPHGSVHRLRSGRRQAHPAQGRLE
jgi:peptide/nickel transport system substrate-binding protein